jgi:hypothetical protein
MKKKDETLRLYPKREQARVLLILAVVLGSATVAALPFYPEWSTLLLLLAGVALCSWLAFAYTRQGWLYLELTPEGFSERNPLTTIKHRWVDIGSFYVGHDEGRPVPAYRLAASLRRWYHRFLNFVDGEDGHLTEVYELRPEALVDLLESWRLRYGVKVPVVRGLIDDALMRVDTGEGPSDATATEARPQSTCRTMSRRVHGSSWPEASEAT